MGAAAVAAHMESMFTQKDLNIAPERRASIPVKKSTQLKRGSVVAQALESLFSGEPATVISSPPGAGKTTTMVDLASFLLRHCDLEVELWTPTRAGAYALAEKIVTEVDAHDPGGDCAVVLAVNNLTPPDNMLDRPRAKRHVTVRTVASAVLSQPKVEVALVDEAYQVTYADLASASDRVEQLLMVGDSGQIGPVVTADVSLFAKRAIQPHTRAPEYFLSKGYKHLTIPHTFRLGPVTTEAIQCLYEFPFASKRPPVRLRLDGRSLDEIEGVPVDPVPTPDHFDAARAVVARVKRLLFAEVVTDDGATKVGEERLAVVVAHNAQVAAITALLEHEGLTHVAVGTADSMQGGQWDVMVALDPITGYEIPAGHQMHTGRLCVMASRHVAHLSWVYPTDWLERLESTDEDETLDTELAIEVRESLLGV